MENKTNYIEPLSEQAIADIKTKYPNLHIVDPKLVTLSLSRIRDAQTKVGEFRKNADRVMRILIEHALGVQDPRQEVRETPLCQYNDSRIEDSDFVAVTILRSGNAFLHELFHVMPDITVGMILIQRNESDSEKKAEHYFSKLPRDIADKRVLLLDPMLATGGSSIKAIEELLKVGVKEENITFINLIAAVSGVDVIFSKFTKIKLVTAAVDPVLKQDSKYIVPGLGDFGCRYFGTW